MRLTKPPEINPAFTPHNILDVIIDLILGKIGDFGSDLATAITTGVGSGILGIIGSFIGGIKTKSDANEGAIVTISADQVAANTRLTQLEDIAGTGVTTPIWSSAGGKDLVSFPRAQMQRLYYEDDDGDGSPSTKQTDIPTFKPGKRVVDMAFLRGGLSGPVVPKVVKIITGNDSGLIDIDAWYLGIYVYRTTDQVMVKIWDSGNLKSILASQRQAYNIGTGLTTDLVQPDHLIAVASLQIAPGVLQGTRSLGCIFTTGISEAAGTIPPAPHAYVTNQSTLPAGIGINGGFFNWEKNKIMWAAVGESS